MSPKVSGPAITSSIVPPSSHPHEPAACSILFPPYAALSLIGCSILFVLCLFLYPPHSLALDPRPLMQPRAPSPETFEGLNIKQVYKAFAAVPHSLAVLEPPQVGRMLLEVVSMSWSPIIQCVVTHSLCWTSGACLLLCMSHSYDGVDLTGTLMCIIHHLFNVVDIVIPCGWTCVENLV